VHSDEPKLGSTTGQAMRRCLQQTRTLGPRSLATQESWRHVVEKKNASVNALVHVVQDDLDIPHQGPLNGMTVAVKDNICTKNMPTTCSSAMLQGKSLPCSSRPRHCTRVTRLSFTVRRDRRPTTERFGCDDHRKNELRRIRHGVRPWPLQGFSRLARFITRPLGL